jgi:3-ketosteroid 9alpha-monooxygenase subunit A
MHNGRRFPFPLYPNGWFQIAYTDELAAGEVKPVQAFGKHFVLFRTESGKPQVLDAFCPHLGAHLGYGGKVEAETIRCPFHAYRYDGAGACVEVPYANKVPPVARLNAQPVLEKNGVIMLHHHEEGLPPHFGLPDVPEYGDEAWTPYEKRYWKIRTRNQEMAENSVDSAHFKYVHGTITQPLTTAKVHGHILHVHSEMKMATPRGTIDGVIESTSHGFGFSLVRFKGIVETLLVTSVTPVDEEYVDVRFAFSVKKLGSESATSGVGAALIADIEKQLREDLPIWENKVFQPQPALCDGDGPIGLFRRWAKQFYSEPSAVQS